MSKTIGFAVHIPVASMLKLDCNPSRLYHNKLARTTTIIHQGRFTMLPSL